jgi:mono/diheme cytochrome c family protein
MENQWYRQHHSENPLRSDSRRNHLNQRKSFAICGLFVVLATGIGGVPSPLPAAEPATLAEQLAREGNASLATAAEQSGDPRKGAVLFHTQHLTCTKCHAAGPGPSPLGPNLAEVQTVEKGSQGETQPARGATPSLVEHLVESLLEPSKTIRPEYRPVTILTEEGQSVSGIVVSESPEVIVLRDAADPGREMTIPRTDIESRT